MQNPFPQNLKRTFDRAYHAEGIPASARSASVVSRKLFSLFPGLRSAVDVGCGPGCWLNELRLCGAERVLGIELVAPDEDLLHVAPSELVVADASSPLDLGERFDIAVCLEVAQFVDPARADILLDNLSRLSDRILFSSASPGQTGIPGNNEQWPSYWAAKLRDRGFICKDQLRADVWYDDRVDWRYRQNMLLFVRDASAPTETLPAIAGSTASPIPLDVVHPDGLLDALHAARLGAASSRPSADRLATESEVRALRNRLREIEQSTSWQIMTAVQRWAKRHDWALQLARKVGRPLASVLRPGR